MQGWVGDFVMKMPIDIRCGSWVVHVQQIHCPVVSLPLDTGVSWVTIHKMGYHGVFDRENPSDQV
jgi:hypothetical protein